MNLLSSLFATLKLNLPLKEIGYMKNIETLCQPGKFKGLAKNCYEIERWLRSYFRYLLDNGYRSQAAMVARVILTLYKERQYEDFRFAYRFYRYLYVEKSTRENVVKYTGDKRFKQYDLGRGTNPRWKERFYS